MEDFSVVIRALAFAADRHQSQKRKNKAGSPYINHPIQVTQLLWEVGGVRDPEILAAGLLHDTVEDTQTTLEELEAEFGTRVAAVVGELTDDKSLPKAERKRLQVEHAPHKSDEAAAVKLADKTCNIGDMVTSPPADWTLDRRQEYVSWAEQVVRGLRNPNQPLLALFARSCADVRSQMEETGE